VLNGGFVMIILNVVMLSAVVSLTRVRVFCPASLFIYFIKLFMAVITAVA